MSRLLLAILALCLTSCGGDTTTLVTPLPSPSPSPSAIHVLVSVSIKPQGGGSAVSSFSAGQEMVLNGSVDAYDSSGAKISDPPIGAWRWSNFSDVQAHCQVFGEVNSSHPHAQCDSQGTFVVQATAQGFDGQDLGISPVFTAVVF